MSSDYCQIAKVIRVSKDDKFTIGTARAILTENRKYEAICNEGRGGSQR